MEHEPLRLILKTCENFLYQVVEDSKGLTLRADAADLLMDLEHLAPGACEVLVSSLLQCLGSTKDSSIK